MEMLPSAHTGAEIHVHMLDHHRLAGLFEEIWVPHQFSDVMRMTLYQRSG